MEHIAFKRGLSTKDANQECSKSTSLISHRQPQALSEGGSIKIPTQCSVNVVNSLLTLLMEKISHAYISAKVEDDKLLHDQHNLLLSACLPRKMLAISKAEDR